MIRYLLTEYAGAFGTEYHFEFAGDSIPEHSHRLNEGHAVRCLKGRIRLHGQISSQDIEPGQEIVFDGTRSHGLMALVDDTVIFNRLEMCLPNYRQLLGTGGIA